MSRRIVRSRLAGSPSARASETGSAPKRTAATTVSGSSSARARIGRALGANERAAGGRAELPSRAWARSAIGRSGLGGGRAVVRRRRVLVALEDQPEAGEGEVVVDLLD